MMEVKRRIYLHPDELPSPDGLNHLQIAALEERKKLKELFSLPLRLQNLRVTDPRIDDELGRFHPVDAFYLSADTPFIGEVKIRAYPSTKWQTWMIETQKVNALIEWRAKKSPKRVKDDLQIHIINFFSDNVCLIWNLDKTPIAFQEDKLLFSMNSNGERNDHIKSVIYLDSSHA